MAVIPGLGREDLNVLTRRLPFNDNGSVPTCYYGGNILTLNSDSDADRSRINERLKLLGRGNKSLFAAIFV